MNREIDEGRALEKIARRLQDEGQATSQRFHDWKRTEQIPNDSTRGGGGREQTDRQQDRQASQLAARWIKVRLTLANAAAEAAWLMDQAKADHTRMLDKHRTPAQVVADGWCGQHWRLIGELEPITLRPTGEPFYSDKCRWCGDNKPDAEMLRARHNGKAIRVPAS